MLTAAHPRTRSGEELDMGSNWEDAPRLPVPGVRMRYKVGAEQLERVASLAHRPDGVFRVARTAPVGPTHAVCAQTGATVCGIKPRDPCGARRGLGGGLLGREMPACFATLAGAS
jgi:hypothetical protein